MAASWALFFWSKINAEAGPGAMPCKGYLSHRMVMRITLALSMWRIAMIHLHISSGRIPQSTCMPKRLNVLSCSLEGDLRMAFNLSLLAIVQIEFQSLSRLSVFKWVNHLQPMKCGERRNIA